VIRSRTVSELRFLIDQVGGLYTRAGLAKRWGITRAAVSEAAHRPDFPQPILIDDGVREVWPGHLADDWRSNARRTPGPKPRTPQ
jgi:hypothetical protein